MDLSKVKLEPDFAQRVRESFRRQGLMATLGATLTSVEAGCVAIEVAFNPGLTQQHGFFHAGVTSSIADTAGGYAGYTLFPADSSVLTVEFKINLVAPAQGDRLRAVGRVLTHGRTLTVCELRVLAFNGNEEKLCAVGQQTLICLRDK
ncbi:MAG TPA: PaaI family thioesterase [Variovorax sp.]